MTTGALQAQNFPYDPVATAAAWRLLIEAGKEPIPEASNCATRGRAEGDRTVAESIADQLGTLYFVTVATAGGCRHEKCVIEILRREGPDDREVAYARYSFALEDGRANISTLRCAMTP